MKQKWGVHLTPTEKKQQTIQAAKALFDSDNGRILLEHLSDFCHFNASTWREDPHATSFNEGLRLAYLHLHSLVHKPMDELIPATPQTTNRNM